jgi:ABC-type transporter MlaC component
MWAMKSLRMLGLATASALVLNSQVAAARIDPALNAFFSRVNSAVTSLAGKTGNRAYSSCLGLLRSLMDMDTVAKQAAADTWAKMTAGQRSAFQTALERRAARDCASQNKNNNGKPLTLIGVRQGSDGDRLLAIGVGQNSGAVRTAIWRIPKHSARAVDLLLDGQSTVLSLRDQFHDILDDVDGNVGAAIDALRR